MDEQILLLIKEILFAVLTVVIPIVSRYAISYLEQLKANQISNVSIMKKNDYIYRIYDVVEQCVEATSQIYVDTLKKNGQFNMEAQKAAFDAAKNAALNLLSNEMKEFIAREYGDVDLYLKMLIEQIVKRNKE